VATLVPLLIIAVIFIFMVVAPGRRRAREAQTMRSTLAPGVDVVTTAGVYGRVDSIDTEQGTVDLEVSDGVIVRFASQAVARVISSDAAADADSDTDADTDAGTDADTDADTVDGAAAEDSNSEHSNSEADGAGESGGHDAAADVTPPSDAGPADADKTADEKKADNGSNRGPDGASS
jgi:preprotein translocase subunit YajC